MKQMNIATGADHSLFEGCLVLKIQCSIVCVGASDELVGLKSGTRMVALRLS